jgi:hypothetical protein
VGVDGCVGVSGGMGLDISSFYLHPYPTPTPTTTSTHPHFAYNGQYYHQIQGGAMGSPLTLAVANCYMFFYERHIVRQINNSGGLYQWRSQDFCICWISASEHGSQMKLMGDDIRTKWWVSTKKNLRSVFAKKFFFFSCPPRNFLWVF